MNPSDYIICTLLMQHQEVILEVLTILLMALIVTSDYPPDHLPTYTAYLACNIEHSNKPYGVSYVNGLHIYLNACLIFLLESFFLDGFTALWCDIVYTTENCQNSSEVKWDPKQRHPTPQPFICPHVFTYLVSNVHYLDGVVDDALSGGCVAQVKLKQGITSYSGTLLVLS